MFYFLWDETPDWRKLSSYQGGCERHSKLGAVATGTERAGWVRKWGGGLTDELAATENVEAG